MRTTIVPGGILHGNWLERVAAECRDYARRYHGDLVGALIDWEGDGPNGSWGLSRDEEDEVARLLGLPYDWRDSK